jgi:hypothetical protein
MGLPGSWGFRLAPKAILLANSFHAINEAVKHTLESSSGASRPADRTRRSQFPGSRAGSFDASSIKSVPEPINKERMDQNKKKEPITGRWAVGKRPKQLVSPLPTARMLLFPEATNAFSMVFSPLSLFGLPGIDDFNALTYTEAKAVKF